ncbi:hypothetical protein CYMTET_2865 [Cymbomonas tetramitiformis]|uniref:Peptidase S1 domain-containing protein n=1 Tax=Cymbomonas tetramitiformis TaxID=36881 RepID=A0AAE0H4J7_9CHLO|nr:hypothetical protein CYMTET_2865 [Cymbomonas tetramitiformis]
MLNVHTEACDFFDACELVRFELKSSEGKNALLNGLDPALKYSLRSRAWTDADVTRWNARFLQPNASISVRAPLIYASQTFSAYYMYTHTDLERFSVATVRADAPHHVIRGYVPEAIDSALQIKLVSDAPPSRVLKASPYWNKNIDDIHAYDDRIDWYVRIDSANYSFKLGGRVKADKALVINFESLNHSHAELGIDDTFGYGMCAPMKTRYVSAPDMPDGFALKPHPHHGFYSVASHGVIVTSGASFIKKNELFKPMRSRVRVDLNFPIKFKSQSSSCRPNVLATAQTLKTSFGKRANRTERVVGGDIVKLRGEFPFMVSVQRSFDDEENALHAHVCGGSLIAPNFVLTAAHCIGSIKTNWLDHTNCFTDAHHVDVGRLSLSNESDMRCVEEIPIADVVVHPDYDGDKLLYDFALLRLVADSSYEPIRLYDPMAKALENVRAHEQMMTSVGWGHTAYKGHLSDDLMMIHTYIYDRDRCKYNYDNVVLENGDKAKVAGVYFGDHNFCAYHKVGSTVIDSCQGDSGGPIFFVHQNVSYLMGVVSFGYECAYRHSAVPGVYANTTHVLEWIREHVDI